jgi:hypothetical protein
MKRFTRLALAAGAMFAALAFSGSAWAVYAPSLTVTSSQNAPGRPTTVLLGHIQTAADDATAKDTIYAPTGYGVNLSQAAGTKIGDVSARIILRNAGNAEVDVEGQVVADNPALYLNNPCTRNPSPHGAVWKLNITIAGTPQTIPIYVDAVTAGPEATFASAKIQLCLPGPTATSVGAQLLFAFFDVNGVFTNPSNTANRIWRAVSTPYVPGTPTPNPVGTTESQALVPGRVSLTMKSKSLKRGRVIISGKLLVGGRPYRGATIELVVPCKRNARTCPTGQKTVARTRTNAQGNYTFQRKIKKRTRFGAEVLELADLALPCPAPPLPPNLVPQGCKGATISFFAFKIVTARHRR